MSRLGALLQNESCVVLQVSYGVNGKDICMNVSKRGLSEIKKAEKRCSVWGSEFFCGAPEMYLLSPSSVV